MNIQTAVKLALEQGKCIARRAKNYKIKPTDTRDCCLIVAIDRPPGRWWNPKADDLMADDWILVD